MNSDQFVHDNTELIAPSLVPEIKLHLASEVLALWHKTEEELVEFDKKHNCETTMLSQRGTPASMSRDMEQ